MTATFDTTPHTEQHGPESTRIWSLGARGIASRALGAVLVLASLGLWIEPGAQMAIDLLVMKLGVSLFLGFAGLALMQDMSRGQDPEVQIDTVRREVRIARQRGRRTSVIRRIAIRDLGRAEAVGNVIRLTAANGALLAAVSLPDADAWSSVYGALQDAGKL
ncbi:hypothetical protein GCM10007385_14950 [Tateyamaria omphalii]|uniref:hypothetical protein n=1 Tax=Tateyamaria omphalii TaxID=299262 RepID=UPI001675168E|nr:hypothetical protein [Tateyamaria omphalii]GGX48143.1 hypothetical protein GCM10007385_14950 [Tateyamaria omphalii]